MGNGSLSSSSNQTKIENDPIIDEPDHYVALDLQYIDKRQTILAENRLRVLSTDTIRNIAKEFLILTERQVISPDKIILTGICFGGRCCIVPKQNINLTLNDLKIQHGSLLCFEPIEISNRHPLSQLFLFSPHDNSRTDYRWNANSTTLNTLLDHIINVFSLKSIKRDTIQLCTFSNENLNQSNNLEKKLHDLGLIKYCSIFVELQKLTPFHTYTRDINILVKSSLHGEILLYASRLDSTSELENQIKRRFPSCYILSTEFNNSRLEPLIINDSKQILQKLGIKSGETIHAFVKSSLQTKLSLKMNTKANELPMSPLNKERQLVYVQCKFSTQDAITIEVSAHDTIALVRSKIAGLKKGHSAIDFQLYSSSTNIDNKQPSRRLTDYGIKPGSTIYANLKEMQNTNMYSIRSDQRTLLSRSSNDYQMFSKPIGLENLGNTCFMNSALQCLIHVTPLTYFFLDAFIRVDTSKYPLNNYNPFDSYGEITSAYAELIWNLRGSNHLELNTIQSFRPTRMKEAIACLAPSFATSDQQDAQEFITFLLDAIHEELRDKNKPDRATIIQHLFFGTLISKITCLECKHVKSTTNHISFLPLSISRQERLFIVHFVTQSGTQDSTTVSININGRIEHLVRKFLEFHCLSHLFNRMVVIGTQTEELKFDTPLKQLSEDEITLVEQDDYIMSIQSDQYDDEFNTLHLEECLQGFVSLEKLEDLWFCQQKTCNRNTNATKQLQFKSLPCVIIIQLKRFSYADSIRQKIDTFIDYPTDGLDLTSLLSLSTSKKEKAIYDLIAVSNHIGTIHSGHYTTFARQDPNVDEWYEFDDTYVSLIHSKQKIVSKDAYLLFYIKRTK